MRLDETPPSAEVICTTCSRAKRADAGLLPAGERYASPRIARVVAEGERRGRPVRILSGRYGLVAADEPLPDYDEALRPAAVPGLVERLVEQLERCRVERIVFHARPRSTPGWAPYFEALEAACARVGVAIVVETVGPEVPEEPASEPGRPGGER